MIFSNDDTTIWLCDTIMLLLVYDAILIVQSVSFILVLYHYIMV